MPESRGPFSYLLRWRVFAFIALGLLILATFGAKAHVWRNPATASAGSQGSSQNARGVAQIVRFTAYDAGIFPRELRAGAGWVSLHFEDMSAEGSSGLALARNANQHLAHVERRPERRREKVRVRLVPGRYIVYDLSRPMNQATLIVEP